MALIVPWPDDISDEQLQKLDDILADVAEDEEVESIEADADGDEGMGTPVAEYGEDGPYHCSNCWFLQNLEPRGEPLGRCNEPHMLKDPKVKKDEHGLAIVNKRLGCCRFVDPVRCEGSDKDFVFAKPSKEEEKEHMA